MLRDHNGFSLFFQLFQQLSKLLGAVPVQVGGRLIQHIDLYPGRIHGRCGDFLFFSAGQGKNAAVQQRLQRKLRYGLLKIALQGFPVQPQIFTGKGQLRPHLHGKKLGARVLKDAADLGGRIARFLPGHIHAAYGAAPSDRSLIKIRDQAVDAAGQSGLSAPGRAGQDNQFSRLDRQINVLYAEAAVFISKAKMFKSDHSEKPPFAKRSKKMSATAASSIPIR